MAGGDVDLPGSKLSRKIAQWSRLMADFHIQDIHLSVGKERRPNRVGTFGNLQTRVVYGYVAVPPAA